MRLHGVLTIAAGAAAMLSFGSLGVTGAASAQAATGAASANPWGKAIAVPGLGALNKGIGASVSAISCAATGSCAAAGSYASKTGDTTPFVANEIKGRWGNAIEVPGFNALPKEQELFEISDSCGSPGNCAVGGTYFGTNNKNFAFLASENNGKWGKAIQVPGLTSRDTGHADSLAALSCTAGNTCAAVGDFSASTPKSGGIFAVSEKNGSWSKAVTVPGPNPGAGARLKSLSCASAGNCSAGGLYQLGGQDEGFVVSEKNGTWGNAIAVPGLSTLNADGDAEVDEIACATPGNCTAGGEYNGGQAFVASEKNGTWGKAIELPGLGALNKGGDVGVVLVACGSAGNCAAGGSYSFTDGDDPTPIRAFVATENKGVWGKATPVPGLSTQNSSLSHVNSIACPSSGPCVAGGTQSENTLQAFLVTQK